MTNIINQYWPEGSVSNFELVFEAGSPLISSKLYNGLPMDDVELNAISGIFKLNKPADIHLALEILVNTFRDNHPADYLLVHRNEDGSFGYRFSDVPDIMLIARLSLLSNSIPCLLHSYKND